MRAMRGLSSATTMQVRTQDRFTFLSWIWGKKKISISKTYELESDKIILVFAEKRRKIVSVF